MWFPSEIYQEAFRSDGSFRDFYVRPAALSDWQRLVTWLQASGHPYSFQIDAPLAPLPLDVTDLIGAESGPLLEIHLERASLSCHFFVADEIEFDLDPREVTGDSASADAVLEFMADLGDALNRPVLMTAENAPDLVIFRYEPETRQIAYHSPRSGR